jgi:MFS superfamily sulfate permease-like transporter
MKHIASFRPRFFEVFRGYSRQTFSADLMAGLVVGIVALPLAIAFGIASGVSPEKGIITAVVAGFVVSLLGGSRVQIGGPTGAFIVIVYGVVQQYGETGLLVATFMAGVLLVAMGLFKLGAVIRFIPYPVVVGFTAGIALTIFTTQIADLFGMNFGFYQIGMYTVTVLQKRFSNGFHKGILLSSQFALSMKSMNVMESYSTSKDSKRSLRAASIVLTSYSEESGLTAAAMIQPFGSS